MSLRRSGGAQRAAALALCTALAAPISVDSAEKPENALYFAAYRGQLEEVERLLAAGADPDGEPGQVRPLAGAMHSRHHQIALRLLAAGADASFGNESGFLLADATSGPDPEVRLELQRALLRTGASVPWFSDCELLVELAEAGDLDLVDATIRAGRRRRPERVTAVPICEAITRDDPSLIRRLIAGGVDLNGGCDGSHPLHEAAGQGNAALVELLIELGADLKGPVAGRGAPLMAAARSGEIAVARVLLDAGGEVNARGTDGRRGKGTPLISAVESNDLEMARFLLDHGADPNLDGPPSPLSITLPGVHNFEMLQLLLHRGATVGDDVDLARAGCQVEKIQWLLEAGANPNRPDRTGTPPLVDLASCGPPMIDLLVAAGAEIGRPDAKGETPLISAAGAARGKTDAIRRLLELGAAIDARDQEGRTALMRAVISDSKLEVVRELVRAGADLRAVDRIGRNSLSIAARAHAHRTIEWLISQGVAEVADQRGWTPAEHYWGSLEQAPRELSLEGLDVRVTAPAIWQSRRNPTGTPQEHLILVRLIEGGRILISTTGVALELEDITPESLTFDPDAATYYLRIGDRNLPCFTREVPIEGLDIVHHVEAGCATPIEGDVLLVVASGEVDDLLYLRWIVEYIVGSVRRVGEGSPVYVLQTAADPGAVAGAEPVPDASPRAGERSSTWREAVAATYGELGPEVAVLLFLLLLAWVLVAARRSGSG